MARRTRKHAALALAGCLGLVGGACNATASSSGTRGTGTGAHGSSQSAPDRDTFVGKVVSGTGAYAGDFGRLRIYLHSRGSGRTRPVKVVLQARPCKGRAHCLRLAGTLKGDLAKRSGGNPDTGRGFSLAGHGRVAPLGKTTANGRGQGSGFIARGHETLSVVLTGPSGSVTIHALSKAVRGFTSH